MTSPRQSPQGPCGPSEHPRRAARGGKQKGARTRADVVQTVARIFVATGDPHRLRLLLLLLDGPLSIGELARATGRTVSLVSQQMRVLRDAKLAKASRAGRTIVYAVIDRRMHVLLETCIGHAMKSGRSP
ncbi:MAG: helix-turn-helix transcriptional regulator [Labilithrix sp.]|nr:helix-turn-helix transcriptional regulator [Labilithrix sp.]MBX3211184.1 helix-turn-helix transcriptional regulator [Labilithrix sp.]